MRSCQIIILLKYKRQSDFLFIQHPFLGAASTAFLWFQRKNKIESVWVGEVQRHLIHLPVRWIQPYLTEAIPQWRHGWDLIQPGSFILKEIEGKKAQTKTTALIAMCPTELLWTVCSNNISLKSGRGVFGLPVSICHSSHLPEPNLSLGWTLENMEHCGHHRAGGQGKGYISTGAARAWLAPKRCWQQVQRPTETNLLTGSHPSSLSVSSDQSTAAFWTLQKKNPSLKWSFLDREPQDTLMSHSPLSSQCTSPAFIHFSLQRAKELVHGKNTNLEESFQSHLDEDIKSLKIHQLPWWLIPIIIQLHCHIQAGSRAQVDAQV